jgi:diacylglycerol kinase (ATP)
MKILLVFNRHAARVNERRIKALAAAFADAGHSVAIIDSYDPLMPGQARSVDCVCIVGGDGTVRDVMSQLGQLPASVRIAVYPLGTINLIAREAGYVTDVERFVARVTSAEAANDFHMVNMNDGLVLVCASVGPDAAAVAGVSTEMKRRFRRFAYLFSALHLLYRWPRHRLEVTVDGKAFPCEAAYLLNGKYYAGPWMLDENANLRNPTMQVLLLPRARRRDYLRLIAATVIHPVFGDRRWHRHTGSSVSINCSEPLPVQADGDITAALPVRFSVRAGAVAFG